VTDTEWTDRTEPDGRRPRGTGTPGTAVPGTAVPGTAPPGTAAAGTAASGTAAPGTAAAGTGTRGTEAAPAAPAGEPAPAAVRVQILATEHWSLLATRQLAWTEAFTRASLFLTVLSAAVVALALVAQTGEDFTLFAVVLLPVVLLLGIATFVRLGQINDEDGRLLVGMNRLRRGYFDIAPDVEQYFVTGGNDDTAGLLVTRGLDSVAKRPMAEQVLVSTPVIVGVLDAVIAGVLCGIGARSAGLSSGPSVGLGVLGGLVLLGLLALLPARQMKAWLGTYRPRFPTDGVG
jgi:hypothetical protein